MGKKLNEQKKKENSPNQIAVFKSRDHQGDRKTKIWMIGQITKLYDSDWSILIT